MLEHRTARTTRSLADQRLPWRRRTMSWTAPGRVVVTGNPSGVSGPSDPSLVVTSGVGGVTPQPTREQLIELCERGIVPESEWRNRDSSGAQQQLGKAWALLRAGCAFRVADSPRSDANTWWIEFTFKGFNYFEVGELEEDTRYIPTAARLDAHGGSDWY